MDLRPTYAEGLLTCELRDGICHLGLNDADAKSLALYLTSLK